MKILLLGEFSNLHWTLAQGLRSLGHQVVVASDGNSFKNYPRDISLERKGYSFTDSCIYFLRLLRLLLGVSKYDVVQVINPSFLHMKKSRIRQIFRYLRMQNPRLFMGAYGSDHYIVRETDSNSLFRYSEYRVNGEKRITFNTENLRREWTTGAGAELGQYVARQVKGIAACLYEYYVIYQKYYPEKLTYIPLPLNFSEIEMKDRKQSDKVNFFIGIQTNREDVKGTDTMLRALVRLVEKYPDRCRMIRVENVTYKEYQRLLNEADVLLDQLYSYTPSMNSLLAMAKGIVVVGGGEEENYEILNEMELRPIINVLPDEEDVFLKLEDLLLYKDIDELSRQSVEYVRRHHDHICVAQQYLDFWNTKR